MSQGVPSGTGHGSSCPQLTSSSGWKLRPRWLDGQGDHVLVGETVRKEAPTARTRAGGWACGQGLKALARAPLRMRSRYALALLEGLTPALPLVQKPCK